MIKRKDALREMLAPVNSPSSNDILASKSVIPSSLKAMGLSLQGLTHEAAEAEHLRAQIESGDVVLEIEPRLIAPSFVSDRLADAAAASNLDDLASSIAENGQQVPILVRPFEVGDTQYQVAYGHRRLEACRQLGRPVNAIVRRLTDQELVTAQGKENLERADLSFIERALFAARLEDRGFDRGTLMAALGVHKGNLSTMIAVARGVPEELIVAIGPAPKIGRPRWEALTELLKNESRAWRSVVEAAEFPRLQSDARFARVLAALAPRPETMRRSIRDSSGSLLAECEQTRGRVRLTIDDGATASFGAYLLENLPEIHAAFRRRLVK